RRYDLFLVRQYVVPAGLWRQWRLLSRGADALREGRVSRGERKHLSLDTPPSTLFRVMETVACPDCDLLQRLPELPPGGKAHCLRCGHRLASAPTNSIDRTLALTVTAAIVLIIANTSPLMGFRPSAAR